MSRNGFQNLDEGSYFILSADLLVVVEKKRFKIHSHFLTRESPVFREQIGEYEALNSPTDRAKATPSPVILDDSVKANDFEKFLSIFYPTNYKYEKPAEDWAVILRLALKWKFDEVRDLCIRELSKNDVSIPTRLAIFEANDLPVRITRPLYGILCAADLPLSFPEMEILGSKTSYIIMTARERLRSTGDGGRSPMPEDRRADVGATLRAIFDSVSPAAATSNGDSADTAGSSAQGPLDPGPTSTNGEDSANGRGRANGSGEGTKGKGAKTGGK